MPKINPQIAKIAFSHPIPGESWARYAPRQAPWQQPPQHVELEKTMNWLFDLLLEPQHMKQLLTLMDGGMSIEAITRTILFTGFTLGKWTPSLMMLMTKPLMLSLIAIAHKAGLHDTPVVFPDSHKRYHAAKKNLYTTNFMAKDQNNQKASGVDDVIAAALAPEQPQQRPTNAGFMNRP